MRQILAKLQAFTIEDWSYLFIAGFFALIVAAAALLAGGSEFVAEPVANCAYFALAVGVILQFASFRKQRKHEVVLNGSS